MFVQHKVKSLEEKKNNVRRMKAIIFCLLGLASLFVSQVEAQQCAVVSTCTNRVAFRLDDIQVYLLKSNSNIFVGFLFINYSAGFFVSKLNLQSSK